MCLFFFIDYKNKLALTTGWLELGLDLNPKFRCVKCLMLVTVLEKLFHYKVFIRFQIADQGIIDGLLK